MQFRVAVVEDDRIQRNALENALNRYAAEKDKNFKIDFYGNGLDIAEQCGGRYDIILMDIEMPQMNGMQAAYRIRMVDENVQILFVTHTAQYAVQGYEVGAADYILKPINYYALAMKLDRVLRRCNAKQSVQIRVSNSSGQYSLAVSKITYIEVTNHELCYHMQNKEVYATGTLKEMEEKLRTEGFARCNNCYLVNLRCVEAVELDAVTINGTRLKMSRTRRKDFMKAMMDYCGGTT